MTNIVYIATSIDGFIAGPNGELDWLQYVSPPDGDDLGFADFLSRVDAVVMGRATFESVVGFGVGWPYTVPGLILSTSMSKAPEGFDQHVTITKGSPSEVVAAAKKLGYSNLYIDGGKTIQAFLSADLIDELIVSEMPILLGDGHRLFGELQERLGFELVGVDVLLDQIVKKRYRRKR